MSAEGQDIAQLSVQTLEGMRTDESFALFFELVSRSCESSSVSEPVLSRKRKVSGQFQVGMGEAVHSATVEEYYRLQYYECLDLAISGIRDCFRQPGYATYSNLESLLITAANKGDYGAYFQQVTSFYTDDINPVQLDAQLQNCGTWFSTDKPRRVSLQDCLQYLRSLSDAQRSFFSEVCSVARLILVMPSTNATSERSFSAMRRLKTYLRSTMKQSRLNHVMLLHMDKERLDCLDLDIIGNEFVSGSEHCLRIFGNFKTE